MEGIEEENKRKRKAMITTAVIQAVMLLIFYFLIAWREPNPPNPEFGIELNFGMTNTGSGNEPVQSTTQSKTTEQEEAAAQQSESESDQTQESTEQKTPVDPVKNPNADVTQEKTEAAKPKQTQSTTDKTTTAKDPKASEKVADKSNTSQGNTGETGDQGNPEGDINKDALYGEPGGGDNGSSLEMSGWQWDSPPDPKDSSQESGKIVFEIEVDSDGYLVKVNVKTSTVSQTLVNRYKAAVQDLTFSKTSTYKPAPSSKGTITFIIRTK